MGAAHGIDMAEKATKVAEEIAENIGAGTTIENVGYRDIEITVHSNEMVQLADAPYPWVIEAVKMDKDGLFVAFYNPETEV